MEETKQCFVRREGTPWRKAQSYEDAALRLYLEQEGDHIRILVPRGEHHPFIAYFSRINHEVCIYRTEKGKEFCAPFSTEHDFIEEQRVEIILERPARVGFINRVTGW